MFVGLVGPCNNNDRELHGGATERA